MLHVHLVYFKNKFYCKYLHLINSLQDRCEYVFISMTHILQCTVEAKGIYMYNVCTYMYMYSHYIHVCNVQ